MNINRYRYILRVAQVGGIQEAADQLFISPSAISQCIAAEEKEHNISIFDRSSKPMRLTVQGSIYLEYIQELLQCYENMETQLTENRLYTNDFQITIAMPAIMISSFFSTVSSQFYARYPGAHFRMISPNANMYETTLLNREADFAILGAFSTCPKITSIELAPYPPPILAAPPLHPIVKKFCALQTWEDRPFINLDEIRGESFILAPSGDWLRSAADTFFKHHNILPNERIQISNSISILRLVNQGLGFGFINAHAELLAGESPSHFFRLETDLFPIKRTIYLQHYYRKHLSAPIRYIVELIRQNHTAFSGIGNF
ncbi:LysR family transcriptional regulator [Oscillibacter sp. MSJ-2]|uniref:LysR family transcriptional regulator n=1 Tax=Dysosmobacter acutus TaxID=2841504 RepID=A0ABS6F852_9FIRM|nr:LysR family transcriptional regulator [Dysosmobacter acutus]MBU5626464.1 LysR family transcriptional regulator [Dysosmobacter acutus]